MEVVARSAEANVGAAEQERRKELLGTLCEHGLSGRGLQTDSPVPGRKRHVQKVKVNNRPGRRPNKDYYQCMTCDLVYLEINLRLKEQNPQSENAQ